MFERDYILRAIKQFVEALARIVQRKEAEQYSQALQEVAAAATTLIGMTTSQLVLLPLDSILDLARSQGSLEVDRAAAAARLLKEHGEILDLKGAEGSKPYYIKAFCVYDELTKGNDTNLSEEHSETLRWLIDRLD